MRLNPFQIAIISYQSGPVPEAAKALAKQHIGEVERTGRYPEAITIERSPGAYDWQAQDRADDLHVMAARLIQYEMHSDRARTGDPSIAILEVTT